MASRRPRRVGEMILRELGEMFSQGRIKDPDIGFVTFTGVDMSPDLRQARAFYSVLGDTVDPEQVQRAMNRVAPWVRREIGQRLKLRSTPAIEFRLDTSLARAARIDQILHEVLPVGDTVVAPGDDPDEDADDAEVLAHDGDEDGR